MAVGLGEQSEVIEIGGWVFRVRRPTGNGPHASIFMMHGWTGDENNMWIFAQRLPANAWLLAPRGLHPAPGGGYAWHPHRNSTWPAMDDLRPAVDALMELLPDLKENIQSRHALEIDLSQFDLVGFSQGAAFSYSLALTRPERVKRLAGLAGFMPDEAEILAAQKPLLNKPVFVAHGTQDERVPVERARLSVEVLEQAGAKVTYCEDNVGHKLSLTCFRSLEAFYKSGG